MIVRRETCIEGTSCLKLMVLRVNMVRQKQHLTKSIHKAYTKLHPYFDMICLAKQVLSLQNFMFE